MKKFLALFCICIILCTQCVVGFADTSVREDPATENVPEISSGAALLMDAQTGAILFKKNADTPYVAASAVQLLTLLLGAERVDANTTVTVPDTLAEEINKNSPHESFFAGEELLLKDLFYATALENAADAAKLIALATSGSESAFLAAATARLTALGITNSAILSSDGFSEKGDVDSTVTARDLALIVKEGLKYEIFKAAFEATEHKTEKTNKTEAGREFTTQCLLLKKGTPNLKYEKATGGKSGWSQQGNYYIAATATEGNQTLICVILNGNSSNNRYNDAAALFEYGFSSYQNVELSRDIFTPAEASIIKDSVAVGTLKMSVPEGTVLTVPKKYADAAITLSQPPTFVYDGQTEIKLLASVTDENGQPVPLGEILLATETELFQPDPPQPPPGKPGNSGEKTAGKTLWKIVRTVLIVLLILVGTVLGLSLILFLISYVQREKRRRRRRRRLMEEAREAELEAAKSASVATGRRHRKTTDE